MYPLIVRDNILLTGDSMENTTLINNSSQFTIGFRDGSLIENLTITGNNRAFSAWEKDSVFIKNVTIENIGLNYEDAGDLTLISYVDYLECDNLIIRNSEASHGSNGLIAKVNSAKLTNCVFDNNIQNCSGVTSASFRVKDSLLIENCIFSNSYSDYVSSDGFSHAEIFNVGDQQFQHAKTTMINCLFSDNYCRHEANVTLSSSYINIINCTFTGNESQLAPIRYGKGQGQIYNSIL